MRSPANRPRAPDWTPLQTLFLIGAARSGTKLLRDVLAEHDRVGAVPFDVNYLWRIGNERLEHDVLEAPLHEGAVRAITSEMAKAGSDVVVEKTVSNCLRVPALAAAFPEAKFVFLVRDGIDVTESAMRQWVAPVDWRYSLRKAFAYPWLAAPRYGLTHIWNTFGGRLSRDDSRISTWGPRYPGIDRDVDRLTLAETCATQWAESVSGAVSGFETARIAPTVVRYATLVEDPVSTVNSIYSACGLKPVASIDRPIKSSEVGKGRRTLSTHDTAAIEGITSEVTRRVNEWIDEQHISG